MEGTKKSAPPPRPPPVTSSMGGGMADPGPYQGRVSLFSGPAHRTPRAAALGLSCGHCWLLKALLTPPSSLLGELLFSMFLLQPWTLHLPHTPFLPHP